MIDQALVEDEVEHRPVVAERRPRGEGHPGGPEGDARLAHDRTRVTTSARVWPLSRCRSTVSLSDSTADTTNAQPSARSSGRIARCRRRCSTFAVKSKVTRGNAAWRPRATASACRGPLRKSGSPNVTWVAPARTCWRTSASTTSTGTTKKRPPYTGGIGQCRQRCLQPRLASTYPTSSCRPSRSSRAYSLRDGSPARLGTGNGSRARCGAAGRAAVPTPDRGRPTPVSSASTSATSGASASPPITESTPWASRYSRFSCA